MPLRKDILIAPESLPLSGEEAHAFLREMETTVLDPFHTHLPAWSIDPDTLLLSLLTAFDGMAIVMRIVQPTLGSVGVWQYLHSRNEGLTISIRWLAGRLAQKTINSITGEQLNLAGQFHSHATAYAQLELLHVGFGKGLFEVQADRSKRTIRFLRPSLKRTGAHLHFADLVHHRQKGMLSNENDGSLRYIADTVATIEPVLSRGRIHHTSILPYLSEAVLDASASVEQPDVVDLEPTSDLGGFSYSDFTCYWRVLLGWSNVAMRLYLRLFEEKVPQSECMPTQVVSGRGFLDAMVTHTKLSAEIVQKITSFLTYDQRDIKGDVFLRPLFTMQNDYIWSPLVVSLSRQPRNVLKALCRNRSTRNLGATLNGTREKRLLLRFGLHIQKNAKYAFKTNVQMYAGNECSELDLLAYRDSVPTQVLLVQAKCVIAADDMNEIESTTKEAEVGKQQVLLCERILRGMSVEQKREMFKFVRWELVDEYFGIVLMPDSEPSGNYAAETVPAISLITFEDRLRQRHLQSPQTIWNSCRSRKWQQKLSSGSDAYVPLVIGGVTYEMPIDIHPEELETLLNANNS